LLEITAGALKNLFYPDIYTINVSLPPKVYLAGLSGLPLRNGEAYETLKPFVHIFLIIPLVG
jgi:hypothetical protein